MPDKNVLPPDHAKMLLAGLESRLPTPDKVRRIVECLDVSHKVSEMERKLYGDDEPFESPLREGIEERYRTIYRHLVERRKQLIALLHLAVTRNEPLHISG